MHDQTLRMKNDMGCFQNIGRLYGFLITSGKHKQLGLFDVEFEDEMDIFHEMRILVQNFHCTQRQWQTNKP